MATTPNSNPNQLNEKELKRLIELLQKIDKYTESTATNVANQAQSAGNARQQLNRLEDEWNDITGDISYASKGFSEILQSLKNSNEGLNESVKAYRGLKSIAETLQRYQQDISEVSEKDVAKQKQRLESEKTRLVTANELLANKKKEGEASRTTFASDKAKNEQEQKHLINVIVNLQNKAQKTKQDYYNLFKARKELQATNNEYTSINKKIEANEKSLIKIEDTLKQNEASIGKFDALAEGVELTLQKIAKEVKFKNVENLDKKLKDIVKETLSTDENLSKLNKSFNSLSNIAQKIQDYQSGSSEIGEKEVKNSLQKLESEKKSLLKADEILKKEQASLTTEKTSNSIKKNVLENLKTSLEQQKALGTWDQKKEDRLTKIEKLYQKQTKISDELNTKLDVNEKAQSKIFDTITNQNGAYNELRSNLSKISKEVRVDFINNIDEGFKNIIEEIQSTDEGINKVKKSFSTITTIAQKIQDHQSGAAELSEKEAKNIIEKLESERKRLSANYELFKLEEQKLKVDQESNKNSLDATEQRIKSLETLNTLTQAEEQELQTLKVQYQGLTEEQTKINNELEVNITSQEKISKIINKQDEAYNKLVTKAKEIKKQQENIRKSMGLSGLAVDSIGKALGKLGLGGLASAMGLDEAKKKMKEVAEEITQGGKKAAGLSGQFRILVAGLKEVGANIFKHLTDPVTIVTGLVAGLSAGIKGLISLFEQTSKFNGDIAKNFALSAEESSKIGDNLRDAANSDFFMSNEEARKAFDAMANATGTINSAFSDGKTVSAMNDMMTYAGYTAEEAGKLYNLGQLNNKSADEMVTSLQGQLKVLQVNNKLRINEKQAVEMVAKASATVRMNLGANPKKLADAAFYASKLGMTLDEISSAAEQTLNFESAIQNQLEYQVLTGKEINIDAYQQAAASGDTAKAAEEMNRILNEQGDSIKNNFFAQESLAKTLGISREQMMKSLELQKIQKKVGGDIAQIEQAINKKMKDGLTFEQAAAEASKESYESMVEQNKNAEVFSRTISKIKEVFMNTIASSQGFKNLLDPKNIDKFVDIIKTKVIPFVQRAGELIGKLIDPNNIDKLVAKFKEIGAILKTAGVVIAGIAGLKLIQGITNLIRGQRGSSPMNPLYVTSTGGGMGGGGLGIPGGGTSMMSNVLKGAGNLVGGKGTMVGRGLRNLSASVIKSNRAGGMMANIASKVLPKAASGALGAISKFAAPITSVAMTGKGLYDSLANEKLRDTGIGGFFEQLGGTGMHILDTMTFGATKFLSNKAGISIPGMDTDDVAAARAIFHKSGRDPDNSRTPMGLDNKQLIQDILANPSAYPEGIVEQAQNVNVEELKNGGLVVKSGLAQVDSGELYLGKNSLQVLKGMNDSLERLVTNTTQLNSLETNFIKVGEIIKSIFTTSVKEIIENVLTTTTDKLSNVKNSTNTTITESKLNSQTVAKSVDNLTNTDLTASVSSSINNVNKLTETSLNTANTLSNIATNVATIATNVATQSNQVSATQLTSTNDVAASVATVINKLSISDLTSISDSDTSTSLTTVVSELSSISDSQQVFNSTTKDIATSLTNVVVKVSEATDSLNTISSFIQQKAVSKFDSNITGETKTNIGIALNELFEKITNKTLEENKEQIVPINNETQVQSSTLTSPNGITTNNTSLITNPITVDNSQVIAAIKELAGVFAANSNKEITLEMNGQKVGKVLTPIMANPMVRQINNTSVLT